MDVIIAPSSRPLSRTITTMRGMKPGSGRRRAPVVSRPESPFCLQRPDALAGAEFVQIDSVVKEPATNYPPLREG
jgi:hypothetical protein